MCPGGYGRHVTSGWDRGRPGSVDWFSVGVARMPVSMLTVVVDCRDPRREAEFWARVLAYKVSQRNRDEFRVSDPAGAGGSLCFMKVPEPEPRAAPAALALPAR